VRTKRECPLHGCNRANANTRDSAGFSRKGIQPLTQGRLQSSSVLVP
jgi:hypothetical protein